MTTQMPEMPMEPPLSRATSEIERLLTRCDELTDEAERLLEERRSLAYQLIDLGYTPSWRRIDY